MKFDEWVDHVEFAANKLHCELFNSTVERKMKEKCSNILFLYRR